MKKIFSFLFIVVLIACQEEITPIIQLNGGPGNPGGNPGGQPENCELPALTPVAGKYANCIPLLSAETFDVVTWNIEQFPKSGSATIALLAEMIPALDADIIAVQEIGTAANFNLLVASLPGWDGVLSGGSLKTGYLYKTSEVSVSAVTYPLSDDSAFPRKPMFITATHTSGLEVTLINLHLKCCDDGNSIPRRRDASEKLKAYIDANLSNKAVVMLGDYNEDITQPEGNNVFKNFVDDPANYRFADMLIAECGSANWSYPSWPSHLDHLLITNELFDKVKDTRVLRLNECEGQYYNAVSDHRPVLLQLE
ncbi:MAG TPA: endonuclease/exonuclease/phosphatase family protein [Cyclobacteriaceae bacterium]|nr:endonuclease/exonuclease/phosphatase family protein [Cyclobacteriaceae bacterium]